MCSISDLRAGKALPPDNFILTFDDATADHAEVVAPLLARRGWKAAFFVPTSKLNRTAIWVVRPDLRALRPGRPLRGVSQP